ncbi:MAG: uroporphyrinogen-III synthase [Candidatus Latescibacterota bacterium]
MTEGAPPIPLPLADRQILVTRRPEQAGPLRELLEQAGARVTLLPLLELGPPDDWAPLDHSLARLDDFDWIVFTSTNAVEACLDRLATISGRPAAAPAETLAGKARIAALGPATAERLQAAGVRVDLVPREHGQSGLAAAFAATPVTDQRFLIPTSDLARPDLAEALSSRGARVEQVTAYTTRPPSGADSPPLSAEEARAIDTVVFASPSAVDGLFAVLGPERAADLLGRAAIACLGPTTAAAVTARGFAPAIAPDDRTVPGLAGAIIAYWSSRT